MTKANMAFIAQSIGILLCGYIMAGLPGTMVAGAMAFIVLGVNHDDRS